MLAKKTDEELLAKYPEHHARRLEMMRERRPQAGFAALLSMMIACAVMLILLAAFLPNSLRSAQVANNASAASWITQVNIAETEYNGAGYGGYVAPNYLAGSLAAVIAKVPACANPMLLSGALVGNPALPAAPIGYTLSFTGTPVSGVTCTGGPTYFYQSYAITLTPISKLSTGEINFYSCVGITASCDGKPHYADNRIANESTDPVWNTTLPANLSTTGGGSSTSSGTPPLARFDPTVHYPAGSMVTLGTPPALALYINGTGNAVFGESPAADTENWFIASYPGPPAVLQAPSPTIGGSSGGIAVQGTGSLPYSSATVSCPFNFNLSGNYCGGNGAPTGGTTTAETVTYSKFYINVPAGFVTPNGNGGYIQVSLVNLSTGATLYACQLPSAATYCQQAKSVTIPALTNLQVQFYTVSQGVNEGTITWTLSQ
jgi:hypothetical protein